MVPLPRQAATTGSKSRQPIAPPVVKFLRKDSTTGTLPERREANDQAVSLIVLSALASKSVGNPSDANWAQHLRTCLLATPVRVLKDPQENTKESSMLQVGV